MSAVLQQVSPETAAAVAAAKTKTEYTSVTMKEPNADGTPRVVQFAGKRKVNKETIIDTSKVEIDVASGIVQFQTGAVSIRMDFRNGDSRLIPLPLSLLARFAGHGGEQKFGDELASPADKPLSEDDMVVAIDDLNAEIQKGEWGKGRAAGGGVAGAGIVLQAVLEVVNKRNEKNGKPPVTLDFVKAYMQKRLESEKDLTRPALYNSFRVAGTDTGIVIARLEAEKNAKSAKVDANAEVDKMTA